MSEQICNRLFAICVVEGKSAILSDLFCNLLSAICTQEHSGIISLLSAMLVLLVWWVLAYIWSVKAEYVLGALVFGMPLWFVKGNFDAIKTSLLFRLVCLLVVLAIVVYCFFWKKDMVHDTNKSKTYSVVEKEINTKAFEEKTKEILDEKGTTFDALSPDDKSAVTFIAANTVYKDTYKPLNTEKDDIAFLIEPMLYATLRKIINNGEQRRDENGNFTRIVKECNKEEHYDIKHRDWLLKKEDEQETISNLSNAKKKVCFKNKINAKDMYLFIRAHSNMIDKIDEYAKGENAAFASELNVTAIMGLFGLENSYIFNFDDEDSETDLVYGISVNEKQKRITVVFRGTVPTLGETKDIQTDLDIRPATWKLPDCLIGDDRFQYKTILKNGDEDSKDKVMQIHNGFKNYMDRKYDAIVNKLKEIYTMKNDNGKELYKSYGLNVTGHSLGGALCTLAAFKFATDSELTKLRKDDDHVSEPVVCVSVASPPVGDKVWAEAFEAIERKNLLRHIRVSNEGDPVPIVPPFLLKPFFFVWLLPILMLKPIPFVPFWFWYLPSSVCKSYHTGINIHLRDERKNSYEVGYYPETKAPYVLVTILKTAFICAIVLVRAIGLLVSCDNPVKHHDVGDYWKRKNHVTKKGSKFENGLELQTIKGLYAERDKRRELGWQHRKEIIKKETTSQKSTPPHEKTPLI